MEPFENRLPEDFTGVFYFTNPDDEDFMGKWDSKAYTYPAMKTTPMVIVNATPLEIQNIRKKFAKELAERMYFKSKEGTRSAAQERNSDGTARFNSFHQAGQYSENELKVYIQKCLDPLPIAQPSVSDVPKPNIEDMLTRDEDGELNTTVVRQKQPLKLKEKAPRNV